MSARDFRDCDWFDRHAEAWREHLAPLFGARVRALEVGSYEGRSACWMMDNLLTHPGSTLTCVDCWDGKDAALGQKTLDAERRFDANLAPHAGRVRKVKSRSLPALAGLLAAGEGGSYGLAFVDGEHEGLAALADLLLCWELLAPGGCLVFDDLRWESDSVRVLPREAWKAFLAMRPRLELLHEHRQGVARKTG